MWDYLMQGIGNLQKGVSDVVNNNNLTKNIDGQKLQQFSDTVGNTINSGVNALQPAGNAISNMFSDFANIGSNIAVVLLII